VDGTSPTVLVEPNSAWVVIIAVSLATLPAALLLRRVIGRPGGSASGLLLVLPLALPMLAAVLFAGGVLPEVTVLRPVQLSRLASEPESLWHLLLFTDERSGSIAFYTFSGTPGQWLLLVGATIVSFMLLRRLAGVVLLRRLVRRCVPLDERGDEVRATVDRLARVADLKSVPEVLVLPEGACGAFAIGIRRPRILVSRDLLERLEASELEAILAHEIAHVESGDMHLVSGAGLLRDMMAWNPAAHVALRLLEADRELEADRRAAAITGKPLALASGLVKMCELLRARPARSYRATLAALRPRGAVQRRVRRLLALADGATIPFRSRVPYVAAACLVAVLGLQVAARVASLSESRFAIVWGSPDVGKARAWPTPKQHARDDAKRWNAVAVERMRMRPGFTLREEDLARWLAAMAEIAKKQGAGAASAWLESRTGWEAVALFSDQGVGPVGIYRVEPTRFPPPRRSGGSERVPE
jgi:Zn-dependent protease with chaperone function